MSMSETCQSCGASIPDWDGSYWARGMRCFTCYEQKQQEENHKPCDKCGARLLPEQLTLYKKQNLCNWCLKDAQYQAKVHECAFCGKWIKDGESKMKMDDGRPVCAQCVEKNASAMGGMRCYSCGEKGKYPFFSPNGKVYCENCADKLHQKEGGWLAQEVGGKSSGLSKGEGNFSPLAKNRPLFSRAVDALKHALE